MSRERLLGKGARQVPHSKNFLLSRLDGDVLGRLSRVSRFVNAASIVTRWTIFRERNEILPESCRVSANQGR